MSNPFLSSTQASAYLRASQNDPSTFRKALHKAVFSDPRESFTLDGPVVHRRSDDPFSEGSFTIMSRHDLGLDDDAHEGDSGCFLSDDPSPELTPDGDEAFRVLMRKFRRLESE
jgi:hypothetical protein